MGVKEFTYPCIQCTKPNMVYALCIIIDFRQIHDRIIEKIMKNIFKYLRSTREAVNWKSSKQQTMFDSIDCYQ